MEFISPEASQFVFSNCLFPESSKVIYLVLICEPDKSGSEINITQANLL